MDKKKKKSGILKEFKKFIMRGNVVDLAVGLMIGASFQTIVRSLVDDIFMPLISRIVGKTDFTNWYILLDGKFQGNLTQAEAAGIPIFKYGVFFTNVINFLIMAMVIFFVVKGINRFSESVGKKLKFSTADEEELTTMKNCPYCQTDISIMATRCPNCTSHLED